MFANPMDDFKCDPDLEKIMDIMFILYADHE
jgi:citrate synthase